jgi:hypothetical protein
LAAGGWNDENYRLITRTPDEIEARLDEVAIDTVIVITEPASKIAQHQLLLERMLRNSAKWRPCAAAGAATVYCRTAPPSVVRQPLRIDLTDKLGRFIQEP